MQESGRSDKSFVIVVGSLVSSFDAELKDASVSMQPSKCIFETPSILLRHSENSFRPNGFSIGPIHHGNKNLVAGEKIKMMYLNHLLSRVINNRWPETMSEEENNIKRQKILNDWIDSVKLIEKEASACYAGHDFATELADDKFVKMMVLDGCFIIELFRKNVEQSYRELEDDPIFSMSCMLQLLFHDLILLENQVPWSVLQTLFDLTKLPSQTMSLIELTLRYFSKAFSSKPPRPQEIAEICSSQDLKIKHILELLRLSQVLPSKEIHNRRTDEWQQIHSLTKLKEAGVRFKKAEAVSILDIKFTDGCLEIPSLLIHDETETILRNLIAYEQCLPNCQPMFTCYAKLLDNLIDRPNDMDILCKKKIFDNWMSPDDATQFFNKLYNDTYVKSFYYSKLAEDLDRHCELCWPDWRASYVHNYFTKPWAIVAQVYAVIILFFTLWRAFI